MIRLQKLSFRIFLLLLLHFCTASFPQPLTAQDKVLPDSLMAYRQMIDQCLRGDKAMNITADDWEKLKAFLSPFQNKKLSDRERNYLSISYFGYLALQDGHADKALALFEIAHNYLSSPKPFYLFRGHHYLYRAKALLDKGDEQRSLQLLKDAQEVFLYRKALALNRMVHSTIYDYYFRKKDFQKALAPLSEIIKDKHTPYHDELQAYIHRAQLYSFLKAYKKADADFAKAKRRIKDKYPQLKAMLLSTLGEHLLGQQKYNEAISHYDEALRKLCPSIGQKYFAQFEPCSQALQILTSLRQRGKAIRQAYQNNRQDTTTAKKLYTNYLTGLRYLDFLSQNYPKLLKPNQWESEKSFFIEHTIATCYLLDRLYPHSNTYLNRALQWGNWNKDASAHSKGINVRTLQQLAANDNRSLLSFYYGRNAIYAMLIHPQGRQFVQIPKSSDFDQELIQLLAYHEEPLRSIRQINDFKKLSLRIYKRLFSKLEIHTKSLTIIPDGLLSNLPFESLIIDEQKTERFPVNYLLFHKIIQYAYSLTQWQKDSTSPPHKSSSVFIFAPNDFEKYQRTALKGMSKHIRFLEINFKCDRWIDAEATAENFKNACTAKPRNMIIFNTHAEADSPAHLYFYDKKQSFSDLTDKPVKANLAVLSTCYSAKTAKGINEQVLQISNTLSQMGIPVTVAPRWSAPQRMALKVLEGFYLKLASGMNKSEAMTQAKITYLQNHKDDALACAPHFWANYFISGNNQPVYHKSYLMPVVIVLLLVLLGVAWRRAVGV